MRLRRLLLAPAALALLGQDAAAPETPAPPAPAPAPAPAPPAADAPRPAPRKVTPMAEPVAPLALLNKQRGKTPELTIRPGPAVRLGGIIVRVRADDTTPDWVMPTFHGAFIQVEEIGKA